MSFKDSTAKVIRAFEEAVLADKHLQDFNDLVNQSLETGHEWWDYAWMASGAGLQAHYASER